MKNFNWGTGIFISLAVFIVAMMSMISYILSLDFYMVSNDTYEKGINYQETIDGRKRSSELNNPVLILFDDPTEALKIIFPTEISSQAPTGNIQLYRPNDSSQDKYYSLSIDENGLQTIPVSKLSKGKWILTLQWNVDTLSYIEEKTIIL